MNVGLSTPPPPRLVQALSAFVIAFGLAGLAACQDLANDLGGGSTTSSADAGATGSVCCNGGSCNDGLDCCQAEGSACSADYDCCGGLCSGGTCVSSGATSCGASLGSRCRTEATCACTTDDDCCQVATGAVCTNSTVTTSGKRCCLQIGIPCGGAFDCCSGSCDPSSSTCN